MAITVVATSVTSDTITCRIEGLVGESYETLQITLNGVTKSVSYSASYMTTTTTFTGLSGNTQYTATGYAVSTDGSTGTGYGYLTTAPNSPTYVSASSITKNSAYIYWDEPSGGASSYRLAIRYGSSSGNLVATYYPTSTGYTVSGLSSGKTYYAGVVARNSNDVEGYSNSTTFTTPYPIPPSIISRIYTIASTTDIYIHWSPASYATGYNIELYEGSSVSGTLVWSQYGCSSTNTKATGLSAGTQYTVKIYAYNSIGNGSASRETVWTIPPAMGAISGSVTETTFTGSWSPVKGATSYTVMLRRGSTSGGAFVSMISTSDTSYTFTGLSTGTTYYFEVFPSNPSGNGDSSHIVKTTLWTYPSAPTLFTITPIDKGFNCRWNASSNATSYRVEAYHASTGQYINYATTTRTSVTISGLNEYVTYQLKLYAQNGLGNSTAVYATGTTLDVTPPTVTITSKDSTGKMYIAWSASDTGSGLRSTSTYLVQITSNGGTTYVGSTYTTNNYYSFTADANGNEFVDGGVYYMRVIAYDAHGNNATATSGAVTYIRARPNNWSWATAKVAGNTINVTATEWNSLCTRINQFRQYKGFGNYSFTTVKTGQTISASIANEAVTAISSMTTTNLPSKVASGGKMTASFFNGLVTALNGIS